MNEVKRKVQSLFHVDLPHTAAIIGDEILCFPVGISKPCVTHGGYRSHARNRFKDALLSGIVVVIPHVFDEKNLNYRAWIFENGYCTLKIPQEFHSILGAEMIEEIGPQGVIEKQISKT